MVFLGSPFIAAKMLEFIIGEKKLDVQAVWTNAAKPFGRGQVIKKTPVNLLAQKHNIACYECEKITKEDEQRLKALSPEFLFIVAFGKILPSSFFNIPSKGSFNLHFSLLPKYRGASPLQSAILNGELKTGITYQKINHLMDRGDIVFQKEFDLKNLSFQEALNRALMVSKESFNEFLNQMRKNTFVKQNEKTASYCQKINKRDGQVKENFTTKGFISKFLSFKEWPGIYFYHKAEKFNIVEINLTPRVEGVRFNQSRFMFLNQVNKKLYLNLLDGWVEILVIQRQGKKKMATKDFLNGSRLRFPLALGNI